MNNITCYDSDGNILTHLYQWDTNQYISIGGIDFSPALKFHFCNRLSDALVVTPVENNNMLKAPVPNILLQDAEPIVIYIFEDRQESCKTTQTIRIPVIPRPKPSDYAYEENIEYINWMRLEENMRQRVDDMISDGRTNWLRLEEDIEQRVDDMISDGRTTIKEFDNAVSFVESIREDVNESAAQARRAAEDAQQSLDTLGDSVSDAQGAATRAEQHADRAEECADSVDPSLIQAQIDNKGDNLFYDATTNLLYLMSNGQIIGDGIQVATGVGGGGGGGYSSTVKLINENGVTTITTTSGKPVWINFTFTSIEDNIPTGDGTCYVIINSITKEIKNITQGYNSVDVSTYLRPGSNNVKIKCEDVYGVSKILSYTISVINLSIESSFNDSLRYDGSITFPYVAYGAVEKTIHFILDGVESSETIKSSGKASVKTFEKMSHGTHLLEVYAEAIVGDDHPESDHLYFDIMCIEDGNETPMIASTCSYNVVKQGELISIPYYVYDPTSLSCKITLSIYDDITNGSLFSSTELTVGREKLSWDTRKYPVGNIAFSISYLYTDKKTGQNLTVIKIHNIIVEESDIVIEEATAGMELYLSAAGRSNNEESQDTWVFHNTANDTTVTTSFENVNWVSSGWMQDNNGDTVLRLNGDAKAVIDLMPFNNSFWIENGKTIELEFAIRDVNDRDAVAIDCMSGDIGFSVTADRAVLKSQNNEIDCRYKDEERVRVAFVIESMSQHRMMSVYLNGVLSGTTVYDTDDNFQQHIPVKISIGSPYCSIDVYTIRSYTLALDFNSITNNYIYDITDVAEKVKLYEDNDIYADYSNLSYDMIKNKISVMTIIGDLPISKGDKKSVMVKFECIKHKDSSVNEMISFYDQNVEIDVQGTSSQWYVRKNYKLKCSTPHLLEKDHIPTNVFCVKADYAESTSTHNTQNANLTHTLYSEKTPAQINNEACRTTIYGYPIVIFHQQTEASDPEFIGKYNFNYDKGSKSIFGFTDAYDVECWEFKNNTSGAVNFKSTVSSDVWIAEYQRIPQSDEDDGFERYYIRNAPSIDEARSKANKYLEEKIANEGTKQAWTGATLTTILPSWADDFEARYSRNELLDQNGNVVKYVVDGEEETVYDISRFKEMHDWVVSTAGDTAKFKREFKDYFDEYFCLIYYVYTFVALMVDQRAKNMFLTYWGKTTDSDGNEIGGKWQPWFYDNDTCFGINNEGKMAFDYYHEDSSIVDGNPVYNGQNSILWTNFKSMYAGEIEKTYQTLRSSGLLTYEKFVEFFINNGSDQWSASIYNEDSDYKYISMLRTDNDASNLYQVRGTGEEHLRYFIKNRLNYCDSKWHASAYADDYVSLRVYTPTTDGVDDPDLIDKINKSISAVPPNPDITVTPFSDMYACVRYKANGERQKQRAVRNIPKVFSPPADTDLSYSENFTPEQFSDTESAIFGASNISSLGDLAPLYCGTLNVSKATKLLSLKVGDATDGYYNGHLNSLTVGTNRLLSHIDIRNCPNLRTSLDLSACPNIKEVYATGSGITSVNLVNGGHIHTLHLPNTIKSLVLLNQSHLYDSGLKFDGYDSINTIQIENCQHIDELSLLNKCNNITQLRLTGVSWSFNDTSFLMSLIDRGIGGKNENGQRTDYPWIDGTCHISELTGAEMSILNRVYPHLKITYDTLTAYIIFMSHDGSTELYRQEVINGANVESPDIATPIKASTAQYDYTFNGWSWDPDGDASETALCGVTADRFVYAAFDATVRTYTVYFYNNDGTEITDYRLTNVPYGSSAEYQGDEPVYQTDIEGLAADHRFSEWSPSPNNIVGDTHCYAQFDFIGYNSIRIVERYISTYSSDTLSEVGDYAFYNCDNLTQVELSCITIIGAHAFDGCENLIKVILPGNTLCELRSEDAFANTPIATGTGLIYVPDGLLEEYRVATNWLTYATQIKPVSALGLEV